MSFQVVSFFWKRDERKRGTRREEEKDDEGPPSRLSTTSSFFFSSFFPPSISPLSSTLRIPPYPYREDRKRMENTCRCPGFFLLSNEQTRPSPSLHHLFSTPFCIPGAYHLRVRRTLEIDPFHEITRVATDTLPRIPNTLLSSRPRSETVDRIHVLEISDRKIGEARGGGRRSHLF